MEPPIHGLNLRSMVLLLAISFSLMLCGEEGAGRSRCLGSGKRQGLEGGRKPQDRRSENSMFAREEGLGSEG
jgi:hypothetical protein